MWQFPSFKTPGFSQERNSKKKKKRGFHLENVEFPEFKVELSLVEAEKLELRKVGSQIFRVEFQSALFLRTKLAKISVESGNREFGSQIPAKMQHVKIHSIKSPPKYNQKNAANTTHPIGVFVTSTILNVFFVVGKRTFSNF